MTDHDSDPHASIEVGWPAVRKVEGAPARFHRDPTPATVDALMVAALAWRRAESGDGGGLLDHVAERTRERADLIDDYTSRQDQRADADLLDAIHAELRSHPVAIDDERISLDVVRKALDIALASADYETAGHLGAALEDEA